MPACERRVAQHVLHVQRQDQEDREEHGPHHEAHDVRRRQRRQADEDRERDERVALPRLPHHERDEQRSGQRRRRRSSSPRPSPSSWPCVIPRTSDTRPGGDEHRSRDVVALAVGVDGSRTAGTGPGRARGSPTGTFTKKIHCHERQIGEDPTEQDSRRRAEPADGPPRAEGDVPLATLAEQSSRGSRAPTA